MTTPTVNAEVDVLVLDLALDLEDLFSRVDEIMAKPIYDEED